MSFVAMFSNVRILCVGDVMLDRFVGGMVRRISPESPVPVLSVVDTKIVAGGAANVARNIEALGGSCTLIGVVGDDYVRRELEAAVASDPRIDPIFVISRDRPTTEKVRFVAHGQHMLRSDREVNTAVPGETEDLLIEEIEKRISGHNTLVLSDYAKGVLTDRVITEAMRIARMAGIPVVVDPKSRNFSRYNGASILTPNANETLLASGIDPNDDDATEQAGQKILAESSIDALLITRAEKGMTVIERNRPIAHIASRAREVADVVGAGDTVIATLALMIGAGAGLVEAATVANAAAGVVVGKRGTATVSQAELFVELGGPSAQAYEPPVDKTVAWYDAAALIDTWRRQGLKVGFTNGCFDILHVGHISLLQFARANCDRLVVGINTDASTQRLKGPTRPINNESDRATMLGALGAVDAVLLFDQDTPKEVIELLQPDVLVKGADYQVSEIVGADTVLARGGEILRFELVAGRSTTSVIAKAQIVKAPVP